MLSTATTTFLLALNLSFAAFAAIPRSPDSRNSRQSSSIADRALDSYPIPDSTPPTALTFTPLTTPHTFHPITFLLAIIEQLPTTCSTHPPTSPLSRITLFMFGDMTFVMKNYERSDASLTYGDVCTAMRGLGEYMSFHELFQEAKFSVTVGEQMVGFGQVVKRTIWEAEMGTGKNNGSSGGGGGGGGGGEDLEAAAVARRRGWVDGGVE